MAEEKDPYYFLSEVSNSDLSELKKYWEPEKVWHDKEKAYAFGTLIDMMITEEHRVNYYQRTCAGRIYTADEFKLAAEMKKAFYRDEFCKLMASKSVYQKVSIRHGFPIEHDGIKFELDVRCKWDLFAKPTLGLSGDIKSTTAETQSQFEAACHHFEYFRQRAWYMDIENVDKDMLIGISKKNQKVFKIPVQRGDSNYLEGKWQYGALALQYWSYFSNINLAA